MKTPFLIGRILFGGFFLYSGINHLVRRRELAQYARAKGVPLAEQGVPLSGILLLIGGSSILLGLKPKLGAAAIVTFLASAAPAIHDFWTAQDPRERQNEMIHFMKDVALLGAALALTGNEEPWAASISLGSRKPSRIESARRLLVA